jgi:hypothetical protein
MFLCLCANIQIWRRLVISCFACASFSSRHGGCWCGEIAGVDLVYMLLCFLANIGVRKKSTNGFWALLCASSSSQSGEWVQRICKNL